MASRGRGTSSGSGQRGGASSSGGGAQQTGTSDPTYNLVSVLYHALQGAENYERYARDADQSGDEDVAEFFREIQEEEQSRADRTKELLASRLEGEEGEE